MFALATLAVLLFALIWQVWLLAPQSAQNGLLFAIVAAIVVLALRVLWRSRGDPSDLGLSPTAWRCGWRPLLVASGFVGLALAGAGYAMGEFSFGAARFKWFLRYASGLLAQQLLLQCVFNNGFARIARESPRPGPERWAATRATLLFSALHAPNPLLMAGTALAGWAWTHHFHRYHNLPALFVSHAWLGVAAMISLGPGPLLDLRVGASALSRLADLFA